MNVIFEYMDIVKLSRNDPYLFVHVKTTVVRHMLFKLNVISGCAQIFNKSHLISYNKKKLNESTVFI